MNFIMFVEYLASYTEMLVFFLLMGVFFEKKYKRIKHTFLVIFCSCAMMLGVQLANKFALFSFSTAIFWTAIASSLALVMYKIRILQSIAVSSMFLVAIGILDFFTVSVIEYVFGPPGIMSSIASEYSMTRTKFVIFVKCILILAYLLTAKFAKRKIDFDNRTCVLFTVSSAVYFVGLSYLVSAAVTSTVEEVRLAVVVGHLFMTLFFVCWLAFVIYSGKYRREQLENAIISTRIEALEEDNTQLGVTYSSLAKTTHDFKNHIRTMSALANDKNYSELEQYLNELNGDMAKVQSISYTGVAHVDAVINSKAQLARENKIEFVASVSYPSDAEIRHMDICAVLVNLLDNAIEACGRVSGEKTVKLSILKANEMFVIKVENTSLPVGDLVTVKDDTLRHGYGIKIVKSITEKYSGTFNTEYSDGIFTSCVLLNNRLGTK